ncbi:zinc-binding metallopeptidase family protein [Xanthocytophaga agilis]|uniref:Zinc-binding metallopeptidase n=1 Tax=Xanthocytophaga agilis TaxID=3048010 RepID=A0AAE3RAI4_9BACT|nr:putative zinc-binding metallopeptidase [Xanthocytophaga agilis]MDJ1506684.1 putative zinc-binding metallopeptidase [Xanthocytophaga agilis]
MNTYTCKCNNTLHFENSQCVSCLREVGWCPECQGIRALEPIDGTSYTCLNCNTQLRKCTNYAVHQVCNRCVHDEGEHTHEFCDYCKFNDVIPDISNPKNKERWYLIEVAKRRLLYNLDILKLPYGTAAEGFELPLSFDFKEDIVVSDPSGSGTIEEKVYTGHADGKITINIAEADPVEREKLRVDFGEPHRTLIGHFRHEIAHYYWQLLVLGKCEDSFKQVFGDHENPSYTDAMNSYYQNGPKPNWQTDYISAYATMHPWEDFAETFGAYLDMVAVLDTAEHVALTINEPIENSGNELLNMLQRYELLGIKINEMNRTMGLLDLVPEVFTAGVVRKMQFIHWLVKKSSMLLRMPAQQTVGA